MMMSGTQLSVEDQRDVLAVFRNRYTANHIPAWVRDADQPYPVQFASDYDWLANTQFAVTTSGKLDRRCRSCLSHPTWPGNPELRRADQAVGMLDA